MMKLSIRATLLANLIVLGVLLLTTSIVGWRALSAANEDLRIVYEDDVVPLNQLKVISDAYAVFVVDASHKVRNGNFTWEEGQKSVADATADIRRDLNAFFGRPGMNATEMRLVQELKSLLVPADAAVEKLNRILQARDSAALDAFIKDELYQTIDPVTEKIGFLIVNQVEDAEAAFKDAEAASATAILVAQAMMVLAVIAIVGGWFITRARVSRPLGELTDAVGRLAEDDYAVSVPHTGKQDELGTMARAVEVLKRHGQEAQSLRAEQEAQRAEGERAKRAALEAMAQKVEGETRVAVDRVAQRTEEMDGHAGAMVLSAGNVSSNSQSVAAAAQQALHNAETVAAAAEELSASIGEISSQVSFGTKVSRKAVETGDRTMVTIESLSESVARIGEVATLISEIAAQTNLLALNATIEAARAGEAGKGFAVVAGEVKNLAAQTARSTEEITRQISDIQASTRATVDAVREIGTTIREMDQVSSAIAAAIEEQGAATQEISRNVIQAAEAAREVSARIQDVSSEASATGDRAATVRTTASDVASSVHELRQVLVRVVRTSMAEVDRRENPRLALEVPCTLMARGQSFAGRLRNLSDGGAYVADVSGIGAGTAGRLAIESAGLDLPFMALESDEGGVHLRFQLSEAERQRVHAFLERSGARAA